ncbi:Uncharacterized protein Rs2_20163 [Raphanus sativus]|nr:Uncharacterized protein Rs2_20163 [Raphanus sativus]
MVTYFPSRFRPSPDSPPWSLCKSRPFKALTLTVPPEPPEPPDVPFFLAPPLQTLESSVNPVAFLPRCSSLVPVGAASPLSFFASTIIVTMTVFVSFGMCVSTAWCRYEHSFPWLDLGVNCLEMSLLPLNEDVTLPLNLHLPQFEDVASDLSLPLHEDVTLCYPVLVPPYGDCCF